MNIKFSRIRDVKKPSFGTLHSAGIDFFVPRFNSLFLKDLENKNNGLMLYSKYRNTIVLKHTDRVIIPSGIKVNLPNSMCLVKFNKSGVSINKGLDKLAEVIDPDYQGEIHIVVYNTSKSLIEINENEKLVQFILLPKFKQIWQEVEETNLYNYITERGENGFGSTGN